MHLLGKEILNVTKVLKILCPIYSRRLSKEVGRTAFTLPLFTACDVAIIRFGSLYSFHLKEIITTTTSLLVKFIFQAASFFYFDLVLVYQSILFINCISFHIICYCSFKLCSKVSYKVLIFFLILRTHVECVGG